MTDYKSLKRLPPPAYVDLIAREEPSRIWASYPVDPNGLGKGWRHVTFGELANAVNRIAHRIVKTVGPAVDFPTIAYLGPNDLRYIILTLATNKSGYKALFVSPRNSIEGQLSLFERTNCHTLAYADNLHTTVSPWLSEREMRAMVVGSLDDWLEETPVPEFPYAKTFEECEWDPYVVLHTSGSTGIPKPIVVRMGMITTGGYSALWHHEFNGRPYAFKTFGSARSVFMPMPLFHAAGLYLTTLTCLYQRTHIILGPATKPLSTSIIQDVIRSIKPGGAVVPPSLLEEMCFEDEALRDLSTLDFAAFAGGPVAKDAGDLLTKNGVRLLNLIASTECAPVALYTPDTEDWNCFLFDDELGGFKWTPVEGYDGVYEQSIVLKDRRSGFQGAFYTFPDLEEWNTHDLFQKHPTKPNHWTYYGRSDNIIVFSNGEKLNPVTIEDRVQGHHDIMGALVVGAGKFQPGLFLEPAKYPSTPQEAQALIDSIWPLIVSVNKESVAHGQIGKQFIAITKADKPFPRAGKGTIQRGLAVKAYKDEIDELYAAAGESQSSAQLKLDVSSEAALVQSIQAAFGAALGDKPLEPDTDFFTAGVDSMGVLAMARSLSGGLKAAHVPIEAASIASRVIYLNPTPRRLAASIYSHISSDATGSDEDGTIHDMQAMLQKYTHDLPSSNASLQPPTAVLLTGSTGAIGSYLLDLLSKNDSVTKIYCLNRAADGHARQTSVSAARGLDTTFSKAEFIHADLSKHNLGLSAADFARLQAEVHLIIHNQWQVDFNLSLASFEPHVRGVRNLVDFSISAAHRPRITFISTIATVSHWTRPEPAPETSLSDYTLPEGGYGQSKMVSSLILDDAARRSGVSSATIRVGQVAGPLSSRGQWNRQEWLPSIVASSAYLGVLPADLGPMRNIEWVPTETEAAAIVDIALSGASGYFHGVNPRRTTWAALLPAVKAYFGERIKGVVPLPEWVERLRLSQMGMKDEDVARNPGIKLLDFYTGMAQAGDAALARLETRRTCEFSASLRELSAVKPEWMALWLEQWGF